MDSGYFLQNVDHSEVHQELSESAGDYAQAHKVEDSVKKQVVGGFHYGIQHIGESHNPAHITEDDNYCKNAHNPGGNEFLFLCHMDNRLFSVEQVEPPGDSHF